MRLAIFTDSLLEQDSEGRVRAVRDRFPEFIAPLRHRLEGLTVAARTRRSPTLLSPEDVLPADLAVVPMPFYEDTAAYYRHLASVQWRARRPLAQVVRAADAVLLRVHHCLAGAVARTARREGKTLALYWAGPPITETAGRNYQGWSPVAVAARLVAALELRSVRRIARGGDLHFFLDEAEYDLMDRPAPVRWVVPSLVSVDDIVAEASARRGGALDIVFAGRLVRHKGIFDLLEAAVSARSRGCDLRLTFAGRGGAGSDLRETARRWDAQDFVRFLGYLPHARLQELLRAAHVLVLPSYAEGIPKVMWEAWAAGLALITTEVGDIGRFAYQGENALIVPTGAPAILSEAIERLAADEALRTRLARGGLKTVRRYTWERQLAEIEVGLREAVADRALGGRGGA